MPEASGPDAGGGTPVFSLGSAASPLRGGGESLSPMTASLGVVEDPLLTLGAAVSNEQLQVGLSGDTLSGCESADLTRNASLSSSAIPSPSREPRAVSGPNFLLPSSKKSWRSWGWRWWRSRPKPPPKLSTPAPIAEEPEEWCRRNSRFSSFGHEHQEMRWEKLSMCTWQATGYQNQATHILKSMSGTAKSGHLTCILGPSGSGKTTLLNVLAGRQSGGRKYKIQITGQVWAGGQRIDPRAVRSRIAYVMQKDEMFATATPREALKFSAALRLSGPRQDRHELVNELLGSLGLLRCADTLIGNAVINGLSGGQRKRTSIGVELITRPDIVLLDEPTSGLDSWAAYQVVRVLKDLAATGCTVICTLHQPSSEIFALVDNAICLCAGHCLFEGSREHMVQFFAKVGYKIPMGFNPADFAIFLMQTEPWERLEAIIRSSRRERERAHGSSSASARIGSGGAASRSELCRTPHTGALVQQAHATMLTPFAQKSFAKQLSQLIKRECRAVFRDRTTLTVRFCLSVVLTFLFGLVFKGVGRSILEREHQSQFDLMWTGLSDEEVRTLRKRKLEWHFNAIVQVALVAMFSACQPVILTFPLERPVFLREHSSGTYNVLPYYLSKVAVEVPLVFVQSLMTLGLCYMIMCLNGDFWFLLCTMVLLSICSVAVALAISCVVRHPRETGAIGPLIFVPQMLFSGMFIPVAHIPGYLRWMQYFSFLQYAIKILGVVEFRAVPDKALLLEAQDIDEASVTTYVTTLVMLVLIFSSTGFWLLLRKSKHIF